MPRIRTIKPELFLSETVAALSLQAERSFIGLLTQADDKGRLRESAPVFNGALWPCRPEHTVADMRSDLDEIVGQGLLCRYEVEGKRYLHFKTWEEHQRISHPSTRNLCPPCPVHDGAFAGQKEFSGKSPEGSGETRQGKERKGKELVKKPTLSTEGGTGGDSARATRSLPADAGVTKKRLLREQDGAHKTTEVKKGAEDVGIYDQPVAPFDDLRDKGAVTKGKKAVGKNGVSPQYFADVEAVIDHLRAARHRIGVSTRVTASWWTETQSLLRGTGARSPFTASQLCDIIDFATANRFWHAHVTDPKGLARHGLKIYSSDEFVLWSVAHGRPKENRPREKAIGADEPRRSGGRRKINADAIRTREDYTEDL